ncbi:GDSL esterase/lipase [Striga asiatica]|uniref:GDSL esterase/lipase n=1 Tax=Striga asiatica TaxID=4170 RepID=A0A5A7RJN9_STRAF|nr:GDSL esterase/lipase [Striga asiatica]
MVSFSFGKSCTMVCLVVFMAMLAYTANAKCSYEAMFSIGSDFRHGANFATSASTVLQPQTSLFVNGVSPFYLQVQVNQMRQFKSKVEEYNTQSKGQTNLPQPDIFGKALYTIYIGQNDLTGYAGSGGPGGVKQVQSELVSQTISSIKQLYDIGARSFLILNIGPVGCYPAFIVQFPHQSSDYDSYGCLGSYNNAVNEYNYALKDAVEQTKQELKDANLMYVDTYSVLQDLFQNPTSHGLQHGTTACCGYGGGSYNFNQQVYCGATKVIDGQTATASACSDPQNYVSWDGIHLTEAANKALAYGILGGSNLNQYCEIQPIDIQKKKDMVSFSFGKSCTMVCLVVFMAMLAYTANAKCSFEAMFVFGDSNSDTGGFFAAFPSQPSPYGMTYFNRPTGRHSDGRLYSIGSDFRHGVNFATSASTVLQPQTSLFVNGLSPFYLQVQINQMKQFKSKVEEYNSQSKGQTNLPQPDIFGKALYTIYIGQNDLTGYAGSGGPGGVKQVQSELVSQTISSIKQLYDIGARSFLILNIWPVGCYPAFIVQFPHQSSDYDSYGCLGSYNNAVNEYNYALKAAVEQTKQELKDANLMYVDTYSVLQDLFQNPTSHGLQHGTTACCGYGGGSYNFNQQVYCGATKVIDGQTATASACSDPQNYVSWDGIHLTEAANKALAYGILGGANLNQYCEIQPIG